MKILKEGIIYLIYNTVFAVFFIAGTPFFLARIIHGKYRKGLRQRFGYLPGNFLKKGAKRIWIHAVSVGETGAAFPIEADIKKLAPEVEIFFSTTTLTGQEVARKRCGEKTFYYPLDFPSVTRRALKYVQPDLFIAMETEIWPNMFRQVKKKDIPVLILNTRISNRSFRRYKKIRFLLREVFKKVDVFGAQTEQDADRLEKIGVEKEKIILTGNSKFDTIGNIDKERLDYFETLFGMKGKKVIVFGSTHPGEEEIILNACRFILKKHPGLRFILCPRHPERAGRVEELVRQNAFKTIRRTELKGDRYVLDEDFIILDTVGELSAIYGLAALVFVGGSLVPKGGQNIIEPAYWGKPVLFGPYTHNFSEIVRIFLEKDAACQVKNGDDLKEKLLFFLSHKEKAEDMGSRARALVQANQGASRKAAEIVLKYL